SEAARAGARGCPPCRRAILCRTLRTPTDRDPRPGGVMSHHQGHELAATAQALVAPGKGILAADESSGTIKKRFDSIQVESTEENRRSYREMLFTTPGCEKYISGVILYDETIRQKASDGTPLAQVLEKR